MMSFIGYLINGSAMYNTATFKKTIRSET